MNEATGNRLGTVANKGLAELTLPLLGRAVVFRSNDRRVLGLFEESFGFWRNLVRDDWSLLPVSVTVEVVPGKAGSLDAGSLDAGSLDAGSLGVEYEMPGPEQLAVSGEGVSGAADRSRGEADARIAAPWLKETATLRYSILEALTLFLVTGHDRLPVHASAVVRDGTALLLLGVSGTGKSTVAHAALRAGFQVLAEDVVYIEPGDRPRFWGGVSRLYLPAGTSEMAVGGGNIEAAALPNGKTKIVVELPPEVSPAVPLKRGILCFMKRGSDRVSWRELSASETERILAEKAEAGFDLYETETRRELTALAEAGAFSLQLSSDPSEAVTALDEILARVNGKRDL